MTSVHQWCSGLGSGQCTSAAAAAPLPAGFGVRHRAAADRGPGGPRRSRPVPVAGMVMASFLSNYGLRNNFPGSPGGPGRTVLTGPTRRWMELGEPKARVGGAGNSSAWHATFGGCARAPLGARRCSQCRPAGSAPLADPVSRVWERASPHFPACWVSGASAAFGRAAFAGPEPIRPPPLWPGRSTPGAGGSRRPGTGRAQPSHPSDPGRAQRLVDLGEQLLEVGIQRDQPGTPISQPVFAGTGRCVHGRAPVVAPTRTVRR